MKVTIDNRTFPACMRILFLMVFVLFASVALQAQVEEEVTEEEEATEEESTKDLRPVRSTFESIWLIDNQTVDVPIKGTFEMDINHRFGLVNQGKYQDLYGIFAASNIRLGFNFVPMNNLQVGFGFTKEPKNWDFNAKYAIMRQSRSGGNPLSITYFGTMVIDRRDLLYSDDSKKFDKFDDRFSYFNQLMIARKFTDKLSLQVAPSLSYFNYVVRDDKLAKDRMNNIHLAVAFLGRYKITDVTGFIVNVDLPITEHAVNNPEPNISFGLEFVSSAHAFQIFLGNYKDIIPQYNNLRNQNKFNGEPKQFLIGFNMTRLWNF